jgi:hypothetical protein
MAVGSPERVTSVSDQSLASYEARCLRGKEDHGILRPPPVLPSCRAGPRPNSPGRSIYQVLLRRTARLVAITDGANGCWVLAKSYRQPVHVPALRVRPVDTSCCGDGFHGGYSAAWVFGYRRLDAIRFAIVAAGLKATRMGTGDALPSRADVEARLELSWRDPDPRHESGRRRRRMLGNAQVQGAR